MSEDIIKDYAQTTDLGATILRYHMSFHANLTNWLISGVLYKIYKEEHLDKVVALFRYFNVIGSDPHGRLGESPRPDLRHHGRISGACFDAALNIIPGLQVYIYIL